MQVQEKLKCLWVALFGTLVIAAFMRADEWRIDRMRSTASGSWDMGTAATARSTGSR